MSDKIRFKAIIWSLVTDGHIWPTFINGDEDCDFDYNDTAKERVIRAAAECELFDLEDTIEQCFLKHMDKTRWVTRLACELKSGVYLPDAMPGMDLVLRDKVRESIWSDFVCSAMRVRDRDRKLKEPWNELFTFKEMFYALHLSPKWPELYAEWERREGPDPMDIRKQRLEDAA